MEKKLDVVFLMVFPGILFCMFVYYIFSFKKFETEPLFLSSHNTVKIIKTKTTKTFFLLSYQIENTKTTEHKIRMVVENNNQFIDVSPDNVTFIYDTKIPKPYLVIKYNAYDKLKTSYVIENKDTRLKNHYFIYTNKK